MRRSYYQKQAIPMKAAELFVRCLEMEQIEYVFGVPGEENAEFLFALDASDQVRFILTRHELGAAFMADVYGRLTGNPAVALGTLGPGATNLVTGVANATMDRSPMLVLTAQGDVQSQHKESHQIIDVVSMYRPITKWATAIRQPNDIPEVVRKAVRVCRSEKPGAVHVELAEDIAGQQATSEPIPPRRFRRPRPDETALSRAHDMLRKSRRPVVIAGNGTIRRRASSELRRFCERTSIGAISTFMGKGCVDMDADYCLFTIGLQQRDQLTHYVQQSDLIIAVGCGTPTATGRSSTSTSLRPRLMRITIRKSS
jgi:acetolactate synthase-1/2/3 large subunit